MNTGVPQGEGLLKRESSPQTGSKSDPSSRISSILSQLDESATPKLRVASSSTLEPSLVEFDGVPLQQRTDPQPETNPPVETGQVETELALLKHDLQLNPLRKDASHLVNLVANTLEAHSAVVLFPAAFIHQIATLLVGSKSFDASGPKAEKNPDQEDGLLPFLSHTLSPHALKSKQPPIKSGPISWVARTGKPLQISPFERESQVLGIYEKAVSIKSFAATPIALPAIGTSTKVGSLRGVLAVDSLKAYRFSSLQLRLLGDLGHQLERILSLHLQLNSLQEHFLEGAHSQSTNRILTREERSSSSPKATQHSITSYEVERFRAAIGKLELLERKPPLAFTRITLSSIEGSRTADRTRNLPTFSSLFPVSELLTVKKRVIESWQCAVRDFQESEPYSNCDIASHALPDELLIVTDHLVAPFKVRKFQGLLLHYLKQKLRYLALSPVEENFRTLSNSLTTISTRPLREFSTGQKSASSDKTPHNARPDSVDSWMRFILNEGGNREVITKKPNDLNSPHGPAIRRKSFTIQHESGQHESKISRRTNILPLATNQMGVVAESENSSEGARPYSNSTRYDLNSNYYLSSTKKKFA